ncbi:hypothetical protein Anapl_14938 [Anas platyrhynchos]|uniref:Uncharacterized protein n=1 Tax=Anas platyrhynchos TaxID=8839 RepID=R0JAD4_ANAPL|nr:hypothetical protein Anapl_14938 [Anas platyrhynchos]
MLVKLRLTSGFPRAGGGAGWTAAARLPSGHGPAVNSGVGGCSSRGTFFSPPKGGQQSPSSHVNTEIGRLTEPEQFQRH